MSSTRLAFWCGASLLVLTALGCGKTGKSGPPSKPGDPVSQAGAGGEPGVLEPEACLSPQPGPSPLLRLADFQLKNTLQDLLQSTPELFERLEPQLGMLSERLDGVVSPYSSTRPGSVTSEPTAAQVESYQMVAQLVAGELSRDADALLVFVGCSPAEAGEEACRDSLLRSFLPRAYRRPPNEEDLAEMREVFSTGRALGGDFASGVRAVVEVVLQGPDLLYLIEQGTSEPQGDVVALSSHETAARLAYFLTGHPPDAELLAAAASGSLSEEALEGQARRLLGSPPSRRLARSFMENLLGLDPPGRDEGLQHPNFTTAFALEETGLFVESVTFDGAGTFEALFSEPTTWVNSALAQFYGLSTIPGAEFERVDLDAGQRAGVLTQAAFLSAHSRVEQTSPVQRAVAVLNRVLCRELPPPPADIDFTPPPELPDDATTRERLLSMTAQAHCQECHRDIDAVALAFENYDPLGRWRDTENGRPIDASGTLAASDAQGRFDNAVQLVRRIAASKDARSCFAGHWMAYAYGRPESPADACARAALEESLEASGGSVVELLVALTKTDQLRYRLASELEP